MNLIAMIGSVANIKKENNISKLTLKVEKPFIDSLHQTDYFDEIEVNLSNQIFHDDINKMKIGTLIGFKGRIKNENNLLKIVAEKIQVF